MLGLDASQDSCKNGLMISFNKIGNLIASRGERPFAPTEEWRSYLILIPEPSLCQKPFGKYRERLIFWVLAYLEN